MATSFAIRYYPLALPTPAEVIIEQPAERRQLAGRPGAFLIQANARERMGTVSVQWALPAAKSAPWLEWWRDDLLQGGAWFFASWPSGEGLRVQRMYCFASEPQWDHAGLGVWRVSASLQFRTGIVAPDPT
jgi:hypothetical protein